METRVYCETIDRCRDCRNWRVEVVGGYCIYLGDEKHMTGKTIPAECPLPKPSDISIDIQ